MPRFPALLRSLVVLALASACVTGDDPLDGENDGFARGKADGALEAGSPEARAVLALVNDPLVSLDELDDDARLNARAARNIIAYRRGQDGVAGTGDDERYDSLEELDAVKYVGPTALAQLLAYAEANGYLVPAGAQSVDVIFSPNDYETSHNARIATLIDAAQHTIDIAMYSYSDARIATALENAVARGVEVRFLFETANADRKKTGADLTNSKSGALERMGIDVRYINKIMHHKFAIIDGPKADVNRADTGTVVSGSGNWSNGAATRYDENTLFLTGYRELSLRMQREFNHLWEHSRDIVIDASLPFVASPLAIAAEDIEDDASSHAYFTSDNFNVTSTTFRVTGANTVSDQLVAAIEGADTQILIASGHLRSRPVAEALMRKRAADPGMDIRVLLDGQEFISSWYHAQQVSDLDDCLVAAGTSTSKQRRCLDKGFYYGYQVGQTGIAVRYKYYAYRWHYSYAKQMHHKYMVIDGDEVWTGSYNLSDNAEHNTMENVLHFRGPEFAALASAYVANFDSIWNLGRGGTQLAELTHAVQTANPVPLVFDPITLTWDEVETLKADIKANCATINDESFRTEPERHWVCYR